MTLNITDQDNRPFIGNPTHISVPGRGSTQTSSGRHHKAAGDIMVPNFILLPCSPGKMSQRFTGYVGSSFHTMSPGNTLKCFLLLSFTWGSPVLSLLSRLRSTLSCTACCVLSTCSLLLALPLIFCPALLCLHWKRLSNPDAVTQPWVQVVDLHSRLWRYFTMVHAALNPSQTL